MTKKEYKKRSGALRKLLRELYAMPQNGRRFEYTFGAIMDGPTKTWHVYNYHSNNRIATVKFLEDKAIIRYRQNSHYSGIIKNLKYQRETIAVPSLNLSARSSWLREQLRERIVTRLQGEVAIRPQNRYRLMQPPGITDNGGVRRDRNGRLRDRRGRFVSASRTRRNRNAYERMQGRIRAMQEASTVSFASTDLTQIYGGSIYRAEYIQPDSFFVPPQQMAELRNMESPDATEE